MLSSLVGEPQAPPVAPQVLPQIPMPLSVPKKSFLSSLKAFFPFHFPSIVIPSKMASFTACQTPHESLALLCPKTSPHNSNLHSPQRGYSSISQGC